MPTGLDKVLQNLNREIEKIENGTLAGVRAAAIFIEDESNQTVPQRLGPLLNSSFSQAEVQGSLIVGRVGYTQLYAPFVHEMPATNNFTKPGTGPKFLQNAIVQNHAAIVDIIRRRAEISGG